MYKKLAENLGQNIKNLRLYSGLTQTDFAWAMHRTVTTVYNWERGANYPDLMAFLEICDFFGVTPNQLLGIDGNPKVDDYFKKQQEMVLELEKLYQVQDQINDRIERYTKELGAFNVPKNPKKKEEK